MMKLTLTNLLKRVTLGLRGINGYRHKVKLVAETNFCSFCLSSSSWSSWCTSHGHVQSLGQRDIASMNKMRLHVSVILHWCYIIKIVL